MEESLEVLREKIQGLEQEAAGARGSDNELYLALLRLLGPLREKEERLARKAAGASPNADFRKRFVKLLHEGSIPNPKPSILDMVEEHCASNMMVCSRPTMAVNLYRTVQLLPGVTTRSRLFDQHRLRVDGPLFNNPLDGPPKLLKAMDSRGRPVVVKMLAGFQRLPLDPAHPQPEPGGSEAEAYRALYKPANGVPLVEADLVTVDLTKEHESTGHRAGRHAALVMPSYCSSAAKCLQFPWDVILVQGRRMQQALDYVHGREYVHMDVKGDNFLVDQSGVWWLGDFGSAVKEGKPIRDTTHWFAPARFKEGDLAKFFMDWHMLAVALVCEVFKDERRPGFQWRDRLVQDGHSPYSKLEIAVQQVTHVKLKEFLEELLEKARPE